MAQIHIKSVKDLVGSHEDQIATAQSLSLHKIDDCTTQSGNPQAKGKVAKIIHFIEVNKA